jgi:hypothetical protein
MVNASTERTPSKDNNTAHGRRAVNPTLGSITPPTGVGCTAGNVGALTTTVIVMELMIV